jgi:hypothetical protein
MEKFANHFPALLCVALISGLAARSNAADVVASNAFEHEVRPLLSKYCYDCHGEGASKGGVALDAPKVDQTSSQNRELWWRVLKNVRAGIMPPQKKPHPSADEKLKLAEWIKRGAFGINPNNPDPGRVTLRRLNRVEYHNTIRDLMDIDYNTTDEFPPDDTGYGFDTIGDVLSVSPMLLEKYMNAAETIVRQSVPTVAKSVPITTLTARDLHTETGATADRLSFYKDVTVRSSYRAANPASYSIHLNVIVRGDFNFDPGRARLVMKVDDVEQWHEEFKWDDGKKYQFDVPQKWDAGRHSLAFELHPLTPVAQRLTNVDLTIQTVTIEGPLEEKFWKVTKDYHRFFPKDEAPKDESGRRQYARQVLAAFTAKAFRRPCDDRTIERLVNIAESVYVQPQKNFEQGISQAMIAVLSSPRFLFRIEKTEPGHAGEAFAPIDEYALASRLSYFLWSTMPDEELFELAGRGELRKNYAAQVKRLMADPRSDAMIHNFAGQWLQLRDVDSIAIDARVVLARDNGTEKQLQEQLAQLRALREQRARELAKGQKPQTRPTTRPQRFRFPQPAIQLDDQLRKAIRLEPEMLFENIVREDRSLADLLDCNYTFVNASLAKLYGMPGIAGNRMRKVELPKDSPRGGLLTMGSILVVTSNPTRTSPVKRGQFILDNILGMPAPPPPADIPPLEDSEKGFKDREPTFREVLEAHRSKALCSSCHSRMDPLGLSLENFNALGMFREKERGQAVNASGKLLTGESFHDARELKQIIKTGHIEDFYRCLAEKMLTYALGRGMDYYDVAAVDQIVAGLQKDDGKFSALLMGVVQSVPFQERRNLSAVSAPEPEHTSHVQP